MLWAAWLAAFGAILAFIVALGVFGLQIKDRRRQQATEVCAWVDNVITAHTQGARFGPTPPRQLAIDEMRVSIHVANQSKEPVWDCAVDVLPDKGAVLDEALGGPEVLGVLPPGYDTTFTKDCRSTIPSWHTVEVAPSQFPSLRIEFTDASGRWWVRSGRGALINQGLVDRMKPRTKLAFWWHNTKLARRRRQRRYNV
jgi:hypothetical protein